MFFKVSESPERYVNTELIESVSFGRLSGRPLADNRKGCVIAFHSGRSMEVSDSAGRLLMEFQESNTSLLDEDVKGEAMQPDKPLLTSRIAQHLRDSAPNGMMLMDLVMMFETSDNELTAALDTLQAERVVVFIDTPSPGRFYHVTNAPRATAPAEAATPLNHTLDSSLQSDTLPSAS